MQNDNSHTRASQTLCPCSKSDTNQVSTVAGDPAVDAEEILSINRKLSCSHYETPGEHQVCCSL